MIHTLFQHPNNYSAVIYKFWYSIQHVIFSDEDFSKLINYFFIKIKTKNVVRLKRPNLEYFLNPSSRLGERSFWKSTFNYLEGVVKIHDSKKTFIFRYKKLIDSAKSAGASKTNHIWWACFQTQSLTSVWVWGRNRAILEVLESIITILKPRRLPKTH